MKPYQPQKKKKFVGRSFELEKLKTIQQLDQARMVIMYGRRRVGKTALLEQALADRCLLKFEGIEGYTQNEQMTRVMHQLSDYAEQPLLRNITVSHWTDVFKYIALYLDEGVCTLYFEELQWLADYTDDFIRELKYAWDNDLSHNPNLILILCGSSPSFMIHHVAHSKALS